MPNKRMIIVSYIPLLEESATTESMPELIRKLDAIDTIGHDVSRIKACAWAQGTIADENCRTFPVFIVKNARKIKEHAERWAENHVRDWFDLCIIDKGDRYYIVLWPNLMKSKYRHFYNHMIIHEEIILEKDWDISFLFCPLVFMSTNREMFDKVKGIIQEETSLGFIDTSEFDFDAGIKAEPGIIGPLKVHFKHELAEKYLEKYDPVVREGD